MARYLVGDGSLGDAHTAARGLDWLVDAGLMAPDEALSLIERLESENFEERADAVEEAVEMVENLSGGRLHWDEGDLFYDWDEEM